MTESFWGVIQSELPPYHPPPPRFVALLKQPTQPVLPGIVLFSIAHVLQIPPNLHLSFFRQCGCLNLSFNNSPHNPQPLLDNF